MVVVTKVVYYSIWLRDNPHTDHSIFDYLGYTLFFSAISVGPTF
jgi:hypothetical protein